MKKAEKPNSPFESDMQITEFNAAELWTRVSGGRIQARYISPFAIILHQEGVYPKIGKGTWIGHFCIIDGSQGLEIGENCDISSGVQIYTHSTAKRCSRGFLKEVAPVKIGDSVFIGPNSIVSMGSIIADQAIIKPLTYLKPYSVVGSGELK